MQSQPQQQKVPKNWPPEVEYLTDQIYSPAVPQETRALLSRRQDALDKIPPSQLPTPPYAHLAITPIIPSTTHPSHPAAGQHGLFATQDLAPSSLVCLYLGRVHLDARSDTDGRSDYDVVLDRTAGLSVDAARCGNEGRMTNDYRGVAAAPNAEFRDCLVRVACARRAGGTKWERRLGIFVMPGGTRGVGGVGIRAGEEVLISYGKEYWDSRGK